MLGTADGSCSWRCEKNDGRDVAPFEMSFALIHTELPWRRGPEEPAGLTGVRGLSPTVITTGTKDLILSNGVRLLLEVVRGRLADWSSEIVPQIVP